MRRSATSGLMPIHAYTGNERMRGICGNNILRMPLSYSDTPGGTLEIAPKTEKTQKLSIYRKKSI